MMTALLIYLAIINAITFVTYGADKSKAQRHKWRTPERTLLLLAALGGAVGAYAAMLTFGHKTKHLRFNILVPLFALIWGTLVYYFLGGDIPSL